MAKGAATEQKLGKLHDKVADIFARVLDTYHKRLDVADKIDVDELEDEMIAELFADNITPNPAMLSAITTFLKNNEIRFDSEQVDNVSQLQKRLDARREQRKSAVDLRTLKVVGDD